MGRAGLGAVTKVKEKMKNKLLMMMLACLAVPAMAQERSFETETKRDNGEEVTVTLGGKEVPVERVTDLDSMSVDDKITSLRSIDGNRLGNVDPDQLESVAVELMAMGPEEAPGIGRVVVGQYAARNLEEPAREQVIREWGYPGGVIAREYMSNQEWREAYFGSAGNGAFVTVTAVADRTGDAGLREAWMDSLVGTGIVPPGEPGRRANQLAQYLGRFDASLRSAVSAQEYEEAEDLLRREIDGLLFAPESSERNARIVELRGKLAVIRESMGQ